MIYTKAEIREHLLTILIENKEEFIKTVDSLNFTSQLNYRDLEHFLETILYASNLFKRYRIYCTKVDDNIQISFSAEFKSEDIYLPENTKYDIYINIPYLSFKNNLLEKIRTERLKELLNQLC